VLANRRIDRDIVIRDRRIPDAEHATRTTEIDPPNLSVRHASTLSA
jgi:hypothetical protein